MRRHNQGRFATLVLCVFACQAYAETDLFDLSLTELSQITVTGATLTESTLTSVPASVSVFHRQDIQKLPVTTLSQLMNLVPGFQTFGVSDSSIAMPGSVRGRRVGVSDREMLVLLNGMKIDNFQSGGYSSALPNISLQNVERIEFIRGPGSAIYGTNAFTGVVNIITNESDSQISLGGGTFNRAYGRLQQRISGDGFSGNLYLDGYRDHGDQYDIQDPNSGNPVSTQDPRQSLSAQLQLNIGNNTRLQWVMAKISGNDFYALGTVHNGTNEVANEYVGLLIDQTLQWHSDINSHLLGGMQYSRQIFDTLPYTAVSPGAVSTPSSDDPLRIRINLDSTEFWLRWQNNWMLSQASSLQFGAEYRQPKMIEAQAANNYDLEQLSQQNFPIDYYGDLNQKTQIIEDVKMDVVGLYAQHQMRWNDTVESIVGARFDLYSQIGNSFSPRIGLIAHPTKTDSVKLLYGHAFRAPQANELYTINNPVLLGNSDLKPETIDTWELIWMHQLHHAELSLNYFYNQANDAILQVFNDVGTRVYINSVDTDVSEGLEFELNARLSSQFKMNFTATRLIETPDYTFRESRTFYSAYGIYNHEAGYGSISLNYHGKKESQIDIDTTRQTLDAFTLVNLKTGLYFSSSGELTLEVLNALNEGYRTPAFSSRIEGGIPNRGREVRLGILWEY